MKQKKCFPLFQKAINDHKNSDGSHNYHDENHDDI